MTPIAGLIGDEFERPFGHASHSPVTRGCATRILRRICTIRTQVGPTPSLHREAPVAAAASSRRRLGLEPGVRVRVGG